jgi:hypothetical protein
MYSKGPGTTLKNLTPRFELRAKIVPDSREAQLHVEAVRVVARQPLPEV